MRVASEMQLKMMVITPSTQGTVDFLGKIDRCPESPQKVGVSRQSHICSSPPGASAGCQFGECRRGSLTSWLLAGPVQRPGRVPPIVYTGQKRCCRASERKGRRQNALRQPISTQLARK